MVVEHMERLRAGTNERLRNERRTLREAASKSLKEAVNLELMSLSAKLKIL